jgi:mono/diheme cytochrome c family protein
MAEAFWWIQWSGNVQPAMEWVREQTPVLVYPALAVTTCFLLWLALRPLSHRPGSRLRRLRQGLTAAAALLLVLFWGVAGGGQAAVAGLGGGQALFAERCGACHTRSRALFRVKTPVEWRRTVTRMREQEGAELTEAQAEQVIAYLTRTRAFSDAWTYRTRCQRCHGLEALKWEDRPPEAWERIVDRLARWSPFYYRADIRRQVVDHLSRTASAEDATLDLPAPQYRAYQELDRRCAQCHSLGWNAEKYAAMDRQGVAAMVRRMLAKNNTRLEEKEVQRLVRDYATVVKDRGLFKRLFPHDLPLREERLKW